MNNINAMVLSIIFFSGSVTMAMQAPSWKDIEVVYFPTKDAEKSLIRADLYNGQAVACYYYFNEHRTNCFMTKRPQIGTVSIPDIYQLLLEKWKTQTQTSTAKKKEKLIISQRKSF